MAAYFFCIFSITVTFQTFLGNFRTEIHNAAAQLVMHTKFTTF